MPRLSLNLALTHEALYPRLESLCRQVEAIASRKPDSDVPPETRTAAEALLFDALRFRRPSTKALAPNPSSRACRGTNHTPRVLPPAPETYAALATALGQALASLDAFETKHSAWSASHNGFVWQLPRNELRPVERLRPKSTRPAAAAGDDRRAAKRRADLLRRIEAKYDDAFEAGLKAATEGLAEAPPSTVIPGRRPGDPTGLSKDAAGLVGWPGQARP